ncbi:MAG: hypothetical protein ABSD72_10350, partial [Terracidiphilus sp.]
MKLGLTAIALAALLNLSPNSHLSLSLAAVAQQQQPAVPDAPTPQAPKPLASDVNGPITPGQGAGETTTGPTSSSNIPGQQPAPTSQAPSSQVPTTQGKDQVQTSAPETPAAGEGVEKVSTLIRVHVNFVEV